MSRLLYFAVYIAGSGLGLVKMLAVARELAPGNFGLYALVAISAGLLGYGSSLGILDAFLVRLNPDRTSLEDRRSARDSGVLFSTFLSIMLAVAVTAIYASTSDHQYGLFTLAIVVSVLVVQNTFNTLMIEIQAKGRSQTYATLLSIKSLVPIIVILSVLPGNNLLFFLVLDLVCLIGLALYCMFASGFPRPSNFSFAEVTSLIRQGAPFTGQNLVQNLCLNMDKWAIGIYLGSVSLGIYNLAAQLIVCGVAFSSMIQVYYLPRTISLFKDGGSSMDLYRSVLRLSAAALAVSSILFAACVAVSFPLIGYFYPDYLDAIKILPITAAAGVVISANQTDLYFRAKLLGGMYLRTQIIALVALLLLYSILVVTGGALWMYAAGFVGARVLQAAVAFGAAYRDASSSEKGAFA
jgi:O-antigen/teichoic acid export membrane protein